MTDSPKPRIVDRILGPSPRERYLDKQVTQIEGMFSQIMDKHENFDIEQAGGEGSSMHEALAGIDMMLDSQGWTNIFQYEEDTGLTLRQIKEASKQIRELIVGNPFIANGARIRAASVWAGGVEFSCRNRSGRQDSKPLPASIQNTMEAPWAQRYIFGNRAHGELERAAFSDGNLFFLGQDSTKRMQRIQVQEISGALHNPNNSEEIFAYRRSWNPDPQNPDKTSQERVRWYYTDAVPVNERKRQIKVRGGALELAEVGYTMIDIAFNRQIGWALGVPDALCVVAWARLYKEFLVNGYVMSRSLAKLAYKITVNNAKAGDNAAQTINKPGQSGSTFLEGSGNALTPLATAGRGYDFSSGNALAGAIAAGLGVSLLALLSNPAAATGSSAAAQTLDPIAKATAAVRRMEWQDDFVRIFRYQGLEKKLSTTWYDMKEDTLARLMQAWTLVDGMEVFGAEVMQREVARVMNINDPGGVPTGWKPKSQRGAADLSTAGTAGATGGSGQGADDGSSSSTDDHDDDEAN